MSEFTFEYVERTDTPLIVGLAGPSTSGKTGSALELAHGFQDVQGGDIGMADSEAGRGNHLQGADRFSDKTKKFKYKYLGFGAPYTPMKYIEVVKGAVAQGVKHLIIDSMSHMHESTGGILEWHDEIAIKKAKDNAARYNKTYTEGDEEKYNLPAWAKPKQAVSMFRAYFTQQKINIIFCFRAKPKIDVKTGKSQGFQPIITDDIVYEMITRFLLYPGAKGVPTYQAHEDDEKKIINVPEQFAGIFKDQNKALSAWHGQQMALWAKGGKPSAPAPAQAQAVNPGLVDSLSKNLRASTNKEQLAAAWTHVNGNAANLTPAEVAILTAVKDDMKTRLTAVPAAAPAETLL